MIKMEENEIIPSLSTPPPPATPPPTSILLPTMPPRMTTTNGLRFANDTGTAVVETSLTSTDPSVITGQNSRFFLHFDKKLSDAVKKFPCLYDSKTVGYKDKHVAAQCWEIVAKEVQVESGEHAQKLYFNLKKRFHKRRNILKRLTRSGTCNQFALKKAKRDVLLYSFLNWLIPFTQVRQPRTPAVKLQGKAEKEENEEDDIDIDRPSFLSGDLKADFNMPPLNESAESVGTLLTTSETESNGNCEEYNVDSDNNMDDDIVTVTPLSPVEPRSAYSIGSAYGLVSSDTTMSRYNIIPSSNHSNQTTTNHVLQNTLKAKPTTAVYTSTTPMPIVIENIRSMNSNVNKTILSRFRSINPNKVEQAVAASTSSKHQKDVVDLNTSNSKINYEDEDSLFGLMIAAELKRFPLKERCIAKHQIQNIVFDMQMSVIKSVDKQ